MRHEFDDSNGVTLPWALGHPLNDSLYECVIVNNTGELMNVACSGEHPFLCLKGGETIEVLDCAQYKYNRTSNICYSEIVKLGIS